MLIPLLSLYLIISPFVIVFLAIGWRIERKEYLRYLKMFNTAADKCLEHESTLKAFLEYSATVKAATRKLDKETGLV